MKITNSQIARYRIIDECLANDAHIPSTSFDPKYIGIWPVVDIIDAIIDKLDLPNGISERTVKEDINRMRESDDLAYYAPIKNERGIGYYYSGVDFKITDNPLTNSDLEFLNEIVSMLKQFKGFKYFDDVDSLIYRIEENVSRSEYNYIEFDTRPEASGLEHIEMLKTAIHNKIVLKIDYHPFEKEILKLNIHPYLLKEYNNRWFVFCYTNEYKGRGVYALDRIKHKVKTSLKYKSISKTIITNYFKDIIGVTNMEDESVQKIVFKLKKFRANYLISKPNHHSQKAVKEDDEFTWFEFRLKINNELIAFLLNFGSDIIIEEPLELKNRVLNIYKTTIENYQ
ncbi:MAG: hypothetical protein DRI86_12165 [Bacteroidetes bacterium]|nr:MAG: hypothetical protein DRI86_12165 [Bacteroidota bacterium]